MTAAPVVVDARGHRCPTPSLKLMKAMQGVPSGTTITLLATDPMARIDVPFLMDQTGGAVVDIVNQDDGLAITILTGDPRPASPTPDDRTD